MSLYLTIYQADNGRPLPDGFRIEPRRRFQWDQEHPSHQSEAAELDARLTLLGIAMESLGYEVSFTSEPPPVDSAPALGFQVVE